MQCDEDDVSTAILSNYMEANTNLNIWETRFYGTCRRFEVRITLVTLLGF
jgi:hypothetical protein